MSELTSVLDELAALDLDTLTGPQKLDLAAELSGAVNRLQSVFCRVVRSADTEQAHAHDGAVSMKAWLRGTCHLSPSEATAVVTTGRRLETLPQTAAAFAAGAITAVHAKVITSAVTDRRVTQAAAVGVDLVETDRILADVAVATTPEVTARAVRRWVMGIDPDGTLDDGADLRRSLSLTPGLDGRVFLRGHLDAVGGELVHTALAALMNGDRPAGDLRSYNERQGDALVTLARGALDAGLPLIRGERPHLRVTIDVESLAAPRGAAGVAGGELPWAGPIGPETARRIACDSIPIRILTDAAGLPLDVGRAQRTATAAIRRAIEIRDGHCVFAGCQAPAEWCDVHHEVHWVFGGPTSCDNGGLLCERHHTCCHEGGFRVARDPGTAVWRTYRPDGSEIVPRGPAGSGPSPPLRR